MQDPDAVVSRWVSGFRLGDLVLSFMVFHVGFTSVMLGAFKFTVCKAVLQKVPEKSEQLPCRSAEVKLFSVFLCQRCREIWCEILVTFSVLHFPGFGRPRENFTKISRQKWCEKRKISHTNSFPDNLRISLSWAWFHRMTPDTRGKPPNSEKRKENKEIQ